MKTNQEPEQVEPAFVIESDDQYYAIIVSSPIRFEVEPNAETIITLLFVGNREPLIYSM